MGQNPVTNENENSNENNDLQKPKRFRRTPPVKKSASKPLLPIRIEIKDDAREDLKKAAKNFSNEAIGTLVQIMRDRNVTATTRMQAASMILDRGHGKAVNQSEVTVGVYDRYSNDDLIKFITGQTKNLIDVTPTKN